MKVPYNRVLVCGEVVFAARGGKLHSFSLHDGTHISTWDHPSVAKDAVGEVQAPEEDAVMENASPADPSVAPDAGEDEPPAKRQKVADVTGDAPAAEEAEASATPEVTEGASGQPDASEEKAAGKKGKKKQGAGHGKNQIARTPERPVISHVECTEDGGHILVVTAHDKTIWVFSHDGNGNLTLFSQRPMPKRPSAILITPDLQVLSADKFGDVYSLPLLGTLYSGEASGATPRSSTPQSVAAKARAKVAANTFTVHSKRNLEALINQQKELELAARSKADVDGAAADKPEGPNFDLTLQLGHVSMLTGLALAESEGRRYIVTADRDEHIRLSRYMPQAHIIEGFCLGHKEFIGDVIIPAGRPDILISGGGDEELFLWDWKAGTVVSKQSILKLAQAILPETTKVAVSGLFSFAYLNGSDTTTFVLAICEGIKAIFSWQLTPDNHLHLPSVLQLPGNPLHLSLYAPSGAFPTIVAAIDPGEGVKAKSLHVLRLTQNEGHIAVDTDSTVRDDALEEEEAEVPEDVVRTLLYTTEALRKQASDADAGAEEDNQETPSEATQG